MVVPIEEVIVHRLTGYKGLGGFVSRGKFRWAMPRLI